MGLASTLQLGIPCAMETKASGSESGLLEGHRFLWISMLLVGVLGCYVPFAGKFTPDPASAAERALQSALIAFAGAVCFVSLGGIWACFAVRCSIGRRALFVAAALACFSIGWRCVPYWVTGVYSRDLGLFPPADMDPRRLAPSIWIGEIWRILVIISGLLAYVGWPVTAILGFRSLWKGRALEGILTVAYSILSVVFLFAFQKFYITWLMD